MGSGPIALLLLASVGPEPPPFDVRLELARPLEVAGSTATRNILRVGLRGRRPEAPPRGAAIRPPVNLALVLDRSASMAGSKLAQARQAARMVVERLGPDDVLALVAYDDDVDVLVPATRLDERGPFLRALDRLEAGGETALFGGVAWGLAEARRFLDPARVSRVVLLSDGQANVGPSAPSELGRIGAAAARDGIAITTIGLGLGYNEDLMTRLARESDGNHGFAESATDLARLFDAELQNGMAVVAAEIELAIALGEGVRVRRALNRPLERYPTAAVGRLVQLGADEEKVFLLELEVPPGTAGRSLVVARAVARGRRLLDGRPVEAQAAARLRFVDDEARAQRAESARVMVSMVEALAVAENRAALELRDVGRVAEAKAALERNAAFLEQKAREYESPELDAYSRENASTATALDDDAWRVTRKRMRARQHELDTQQGY